MGGLAEAHSPHLETVALASLVLLPELQPRAGGTEWATVERYRQVMAAKGAEAFPPIKVARLNGALALYDGWHRLAAMEAVGEWQAVAEVRDAASIEQVRLWAFEANGEHGKPLSPKDRREMFRAYVKARKHHFEGGRQGRLKPYRNQAADLGIPKSTLATWMADDFPDVAAALAERDGFPGSNRGGARTIGPQKRLAREAAEGLRAAKAALPGVTDGEDRWGLLEAAREIVRELEAGEVKEPLF